MRGEGMMNRYMAAGCSNTPRDRVTLFKFPSDAILICKWEKQVQRTRTQGKATEHSFLCSNHFIEDCFEFEWAFASQFGQKKWRRLKPGAVPTVFYQPSMAQVRTSRAEEQLLCKRTTDAYALVGDEGPSKRKEEPWRRERGVRYKLII